MQAEDARFPDRLRRVRQALLTDDLEALLFLDMKNIRYLTGFTGSDGLFLLERNQSVLMVDGRYTTQAGLEANGISIFQYREKLDGIAEVTADRAITSVGFEAAALSFELYSKLKEKIPALNLRPLDGDLVNLRAIKDEGEIALLRKAAATASQAVLAIQKLIRPGLREDDVVLELEYRMRQLGAAGAAFPTIVAAGLNSALPHAHPGARKLAAGDALVIDYGAVIEGYHSDETCTFVLGQASAQFQEVYEIVKAAHDRALEAVKAGVACAAIDLIARNCIEKAGFGRFFSHGTGHGVGLDVHEPPRIAPPSRAILEAGMVVTIEPGIYLPGQWGIRIEDTVLVREHDCEVLTGIPKNLTVLH
jgi:Xaa-Pro aminopeptidase